MSFLCTANGILFRLFSLNDLCDFLGNLNLLLFSLTVRKYDIILLLANNLVIVSRFVIS